MAKKQQTLWVVALAALLIVLGAAPDTLHAGGESMTLRINDTQAEPGGLVAVVVRTYAPRGVAQGQICFNVQGARGASGDPFVALEQVLVFSEQGDAQVVQTFDDAAQMTLIEFESLSATINWADGPMAVLFFRLSLSVAPGQEFDLALDLGETFLIDGESQSILLEPRSGTLTIRSPGEPYELSAEGDNVATGSSAILGVNTNALFAIGSGQVALRYDPAVAAGPPIVTMDRRHGSSTFSVDDQVAGLVVVSFSSVDSSLNSVPGQLITIEVPISANAQPGVSVVSLDPDLTHLEDALLMPIPLVLADDVLELEAGAVIFADGFESADLEEWTAVH